MAPPFFTELSPSNVQFVRLTPALLKLSIAPPLPVWSLLPEALFWVNVQLVTVGPVPYSFAIAPPRFAVLLRNEQLSKVIVQLAFSSNTPPPFWRPLLFSKMQLLMVGLPPLS